MGSRTDSINDDFLTFRRLGGKGRIKIEGLVGHNGRFKGRILLLLLELVPINGSKKAMLKEFFDAVWTCNQHGV